MITSCTGWSMWLACTQRKHGEFEHICNGSSHLITPTPSLWVPIACLCNYTVDPMFSSYSPPLLSPSNDNIKIWFMKTKPIYIVIRVLFFWRLEQWCMRDDGCGTRSVTEQRVLLLLHCPILFMCAHCPTMEFPLLFCPLLIYLVPLPLDHFWSSILITNPHFIIFFFPNKIECHPPQKNGFQYQIVIQWNLP